MSVVGLRLKSAREGKRLSLRKFAEEIDEDFTVLWRIERGHRFPPKLRLESFAKVLSLTPQQLEALIAVERRGLNPHESKLFSLERAGFSSSTAISKGKKSPAQAVLCAAACIQTATAAKIESSSLIRVAFVAISFRLKSAGLPLHTKLGITSCIVGTKSPHSYFFGSPKAQLFVGKLSARKNSLAPWNIRRAYLPLAC